MELNIDRGLKSYDVKDADGTLIGTMPNLRRQFWICCPPPSRGWQMGFQPLLGILSVILFRV